MTTLAYGVKDACRAQELSIGSAMPAVKMSAARLRRISSCANTRLNRWFGIRQVTLGKDKLEELVGESDTSKPLNPRFFVFLRTTGALMTTYTILGVAYCNYSIMGPDSLF